MVEILAASLTGANHSFESTSLFDDRGNPPGLGQMIIAIDPAATGGAGTAERLRQLAATMMADPGLRLPGRRSQAAGGMRLRRDWTSIAKWPRCLRRDIAPAHASYLGPEQDGVVAVLPHGITVCQNDMVVVRRTERTVK